MATTNGKGTTPKETFVALGKEVRQASKGQVLAWLAVFLVFERDGWEDKRAFSKAFAAVNSEWKPDTVRVNLSHIGWAQENIKGGAKACASMAHIIESKKGKKAKAEPAKAHRVSTVTVSDTEFARALRKAGLSAEVIAIATKAVFTTAK